MLYCQHISYKMLPEAKDTLWKHQGTWSNKLLLAKVHRYSTVCAETFKPLFSLCSRYFRNLEGSHKDLKCTMSGTHNFISIQKCCVWGSLSASVKLSSFKNSVISGSYNLQPPSGEQGDIGVYRSPVRTADVAYNFYELDEGKA
jgi:hypothetical protein